MDDEGFALSVPQVPHSANAALLLLFQVLAHQNARTGFGEQGRPVPSFIRSFNEGYHVCCKIAAVSIFAVLCVLAPNDLEV